MHFACWTVDHELIKQSIWNASPIATLCGLLATLIARTCETVLPDLLGKVMTYSSTTVTYSSTANKYSTKHRHTRLTALCPGLPGWAGTRKIKPIWIVLKQETVSGSGISWAICKSAPCSRQIIMPVPRHSIFYRPDAFPVAQPTASKHWRQPKYC